MKHLKRNFTSALADEMKVHGVALLESGAYVHRSFDENELEELKKLEHQKIGFEKAYSVIVVKGRVKSRGRLARLARLSTKDKKVAKFPKTGGIITLHILNGEAFSIQEFADKVKDNQITKIRKKNLPKPNEYTGVLYGSLDPMPQYATLIVVDNGHMSFIDIEAKKERPNNRLEFCKVLSLNADDRRQGMETQKALARIATGQT